MDCAPWQYNFKHLVYMIGIFYKHAVLNKFGLESLLVQAACVRHMWWWLQAKLAIVIVITYF